MKVRAAWVAGEFSRQRLMTSPVPTMKSARPIRDRCYPVRCSTKWGDDCHKGTSTSRSCRDKRRGLTSCDLHLQSQSLHHALVSAFDFSVHLPPRVDRFDPRSFVSALEAGKACQPGLRLWHGTGTCLWYGTWTRSRGATGAFSGSSAGERRDVLGQRSWDHIVSSD